MKGLLRALRKELPPNPKQTPNVRQGSLDLPSKGQSPTRCAVVFAGSSQASDAVDTAAIVKLIIQ